MQKNHKEFLRHDFSDTEIADFARELARSNRQKAQIEQRKKEVDAQLKGEIEAENSTIQRLSSFVVEGFEYREVECRTEMDTPEKGRKRIIRLDTNEEVKVLAMTESDKQMVLDLEAKDVPENTNGHAADVPDHEPAPEPAAPLASVVHMGGSHQAGRKQRKARNPEQEAIADGTAPMEDETAEDNTPF